MMAGGKFGGLFVSSPLTFLHMVLACFPPQIEI